MIKTNKKYIDVDVIAFLEEVMKGNTEHYQSDFDIDKDIILRCAKSERKEDKTLLWLSRAMGTQCNKEQDVFIKDTAGHTTWLYFGEQASDKDAFVACAVEITGETAGIVRGNVFVLNFAELITDIKTQSVAPLEYEKTFEDGFGMSVPIHQSSSGFYHDFVEKHGAIVDSLAIPQDADELGLVLAGQKRKRDKLRLGRADGFKLGLDAQIKGTASQDSASKEHGALSKGTAFEQLI